MTQLQLVHTILTTTALVVLTAGLLHLKQILLRLGKAAR